MEDNSSVDDYFPIPPDTASLFVASINLRMFVVPHLASTVIFFEYYCRMLITFHRSLAIFSEKVQFCFVSAAIYKSKFGPLNFLTSNHVTLKWLLCVSSLNANAPKKIFCDCNNEEICSES